MGKKRRVSHHKGGSSKTQKSSSKSQKSLSDPSTSVSLENAIRGLTNLGNTCFFNASLQSLIAILEEDLHNSILLNDINYKVYSHFYEILSVLSIRGQKIVNPSQLLTSLTTKVHQFNNRRQHDSHELILHLLSTIFEEFDKKKPSTPHPLQLLFNGNLAGIVCCQHCQYRSCSINKFIDISLEIPGSKHLFRYPTRSVVMPTRVTRSSKKKQAEQTLEEKATREEKKLPEANAGEGKTEHEDVTPNDDASSPIAIDGDTTPDSLNEMEESAILKKSPSSTNDPSEDSSLQIIEPPEDSAPSSNLSSITLFDCLKQYTSREMLTVESGEGYLCPKCSEITSENNIIVQKRAATKRLLILDQPSLLIIHLKRLLPGGKCMSFISFPLQLSLEPFLGMRASSSIDVSSSNPQSNPSSFYQLKAVIVHHGSGSGGHYVAYVHRSSQWYFTSDAATRKTTESEVLQAQAYILMYRFVKQEEQQPPVDVIDEVTNQLKTLNMQRSNSGQVVGARGDGDDAEESKVERNNEEEKETDVEDEGQGSDKE